MVWTPRRLRVAIAFARASRTSCATTRSYSATLESGLRVATSASCAAAARREVRAHVIGEPQQTDLIALADRDVGQHERRVDGMIELGELAERARHHPTGVEQDHETLLPLGLVLHADRTSPTRGRGPRDRSRI